MGNCQAMNASVLVIQHPDGKLEKMYWSVSASEVMRKNPDHYVSLILGLPESQEEAKIELQRLRSTHTHVKLLRSFDTLNLGSAYRLVPSKEALDVLRASKSARVSRSRSNTDKNVSNIGQGLADKTENIEDIFKATGKRSRSVTRKPSMRRSKSWHPSLMTIAEIPSQ